MMSSFETSTDHVQLLNAAFESFPGALVILDKNQAITFASESFWTFTGLTQQDPSFSSLVKALGFDPVRSLSQSRNSHLLKEVTMLKTPYSTLLTRIQDQAQQTMGTLIYFRDISEEKELENLKEEFITQLTHDLKIPLTTIKASIDLLNTGLAPKEKTPDIIQHTLNGVKRMTRLINNFLMMSKLEAGKMQLHKEQISLVSMIHELVVSFTDRAQEKKISLIPNIESELPVVELDEELMRRALDNLIDNALKFTPKGGVIKVTANNHEDDHIQIEISDTGIGVPEEQLLTIFDKYKQVKQPHTASAGVGIGLATVKEIIKAHKGTVQCRKNPDQGLTFSITLPIR